MNRLAPMKVDQLIRCFEAGASVRASARTVGVSTVTASRYHARWRHRRPEPGAIMPVLDPVTFRRLSAVAERRGTTPSELAARILAAVVDAGLVDLVLA